MDSDEGEDIEFDDGESAEDSDVEMDAGEIEVGSVPPLFRSTS